MDKRRFQHQHRQKPDVETILFLIGIQELGDIKAKFTKEQKQDLMHVAVCTVLMPSGYYEIEGVDKDGWPHFKQLKAMPENNETANKNRFAETSVNNEQHSESSKPDAESQTLGTP